MANAQTEHYGLNQWSPGDPVLREEFNRDNANLDKTLECFPCVRLACAEITSAASQMELNLSNIKLTAYSGYKLFIQLPPQTATLEITINKATAYYSGSATTNSSFFESTCLAQIEATEFGSFMACLQFAISHQKGSAGYFLTTECTHFYYHASDRGGSHSRGICCLSELTGVILCFSSAGDNTLLPVGTKAVLYGLKW